MTRLERHFTSMETSKALDEAGIRHAGHGKGKKFVEGRPLFAWVNRYSERDRADNWYVLPEDSTYMFKQKEGRHYPAFLLSELMELDEAKKLEICVTFSGYGSRNCFAKQKSGENECNNNWAEAVAQLILKSKRV